MGVQVGYMGDPSRWSRGVTGDKSSKDMGDTTSGCLRTFEACPGWRPHQWSSAKNFSRPRSAASTASPSCVVVTASAARMATKCLNRLNRYRIEVAFPHGDVSFDDRSRRPHRSPTAISAEVEAAIVELRKQRPHWPQETSRGARQAEPRARVAVGEHVRGRVEAARLGQAAPQADEEHAVH